MASRFIIAAMASLCAMSSSSAIAQSPARETPGAVQALSRCLIIAAAAERLTCLEAATRALDTAIRDGVLVVVDQSLATEARRQSFGTNAAPVDVLLPVQSAQRVDAIETSLTRASQASDGHWTFFLADGSVWTQIGTDRVTFRNREGEPVRVRRAAMGSYLLTVGRSTAVRVTRR